MATTTAATCEIRIITSLLPRLSDDICSREEASLRETARSRPRVIPPLVVQIISSNPSPGVLSSALILYMVQKVRTHFEHPSTLQAPPAPGSDRPGRAPAGSLMRFGRHFDVTYARHGACSSFGPIHRHLCTAWGLFFLWTDTSGARLRLLSPEGLTAGAAHLRLSRGRWRREPRSRGPGSRRRSRAGREEKTCRRHAEIGLDVATSRVARARANTQGMRTGAGSG